MNSTVMNTIKALVEHKKYDAITEYANVLHGKDNLIVSEYGGANVRLYKDAGNNAHILCPKNMDTVQEGYLANAIATGSVFDDADEIDRNASVIERTTLPYDAMVNGGKEPPQHLRPMIAIVVGRMGDDGKFGVTDADRINGINFVKDATNANANGDKVNGVVDNYLEKQDGGFYTPEIGKNISGLNRELGDVNDTDPGDVVSDDDTVDSYDGYDMDEIERDPDADTTDDHDEPVNDVPPADEPDEDEENTNPDDQLDIDNGEEEANNDEEGEPGEVSDEEETEPGPEEEEPVEECGSNCDTGDKPVVQEEDHKVFDESLKVSREDMKGEFMKNNPDGTYHSGKKTKEKKPALKLTSDKISAKSEDLKNAMTGDFIRCVDKDGKVKMIKVTIGKALIDKHDKVVININDDSAKITVDNEPEKEENKSMKKKKVIKRTPFGPIATWVYESTNEVLFDEAVFDEAFVQEEDETVDNSEDTTTESTDVSDEDVSEDTSDATEEVTEESYTFDDNTDFVAESMMNSLMKTFGGHPKTVVVESAKDDEKEPEVVEEEKEVKEETESETTEEAVTLDQNIKGATEAGTVKETPSPMSAETKSILNNQVHQEGFLTKKPKKLKPIGRDVVAYITCEMNAIHSSNDQAMLAGYTCSKLELVDWYITVLDTQDPKYIVPHTRQYLVTMKAQLESLLAQILKIRPINRSEQIWRVNYPVQA